MREIKFRVWDKKRKEWIYDAYVDLTKGKLTLQWKTDGSYEWVQYTGLKDKNGKEIYEGDVIQFWDRGNIFDNELLPCTANVVMRYAKWYPEPINVRGLRSFEFKGYDWENENCEVIGNIYEIGGIK